MMNEEVDGVTLTQQTWEERSEARIEAMIESARRKFISFYPGQDFDAQTWDTFHLAERPGANVHRSLCFTATLSSKRGKKGISNDPANGLPTYIANVFKSWIVLGPDLTPGSNNVRVSTARYFWHFLVMRRAAVPAEFRWGALTESDFLSLELFLEEYRQANGKRLAPDTILKIISNLQYLVNFLGSRGICRRITYAPRVRSGRKRAVERLEGRRHAAENKLPDTKVLNAIGSIYHRVTMDLVEQVNEYVLILISAVAIMLLTGMRIGELLTLPFDCEVEEETPVGNSLSYEKRYGLRYWPEKKRRLVIHVKWISPTAEPVVRAAVARIKRLTERARLRAKILEADPTRVPLPPGFDGRESITMAELNTLLGQKSGSTYKKIAHTFLHRKGYYRLADIESYLLARRVADLYTIKRDGQGVQSLSNSLFIAFAGQSRFMRCSPCILLVEPVTPNMLRAFMNVPKSGRKTTLFATFGTSEEQKALSAKPTSFRHWLNHVAYKGKMPIHLIARYFARESPRNTRDYLHYSPEKVGEYVREEVRAGRVFGPVAKTYWSLPSDQREEYLIGQVTVGHFTPWGLCVRNLAMYPCDKHLNCLNDCGSFCSSKGDAGEIAALLDLEAKTMALLEKSREAERDGQKWADAYVSYHRKTLAKIRAVLAKHGDPSVGVGTLVHPFKGESVRRDLQ